MVHNARGKTAAAERLLSEVLDVQRRVLGNKHPDTLVTMVTLGELYIYQRKLDQAEQLLVEAVEGSRTALDRNSQTIAAALSLLGAVYANKGDLKKLGPVLIESRDIARFRWGPDHGLTAAGNQAVGLFFRAEKDYARAEPFFRECLAYWVKTSPDNWNRYVNETSLGLCLLNQQKDAEAERLLFSAYQGLKAREKDIGPSGKDYIQSTVDLIVQLYNRSRRLHAEADLRVVRSNPDFQVITMDLKFPADPFARP